MAFAGQDTIELSDGRFSAEPSEASLLRAYQVWQLIRRNRGALAPFLPGVIVRNRTPLDTYRRQKALRESTYEEGYVLVDELELGVCGIATLRALPNPSIGVGTGIQMDYWLDHLLPTEVRTGLAVGLCSGLIARADAITTQEGLQLPPHALISTKNPAADPSREFCDSSQLTPIGTTRLAAQSAGFNGSQESYLIYSRFSPQQTENHLTKTE